MGASVSSLKQVISDATDQIENKIAKCIAGNSDIIELSQKLRDISQAINDRSNYSAELQNAINQLQSATYGWCSGKIIMKDPCNDPPTTLSDLHNAYGYAAAPQVHEDFKSWWWFGAFDWVSSDLIFTVIRNTFIAVLLALTIEELIAAVIAAIAGGAVVVAAAASTNNINTGTVDSNGILAINSSTGALTIDPNVKGTVETILTNVSIKPAAISATTSKVTHVTVSYNGNTKVYSKIQLAQIYADLKDLGNSGKIKSFTDVQNYIKTIA
jgi:hypothetical protein